MGNSLTRDNAADRRRRTIEAPNGARVIMPVGTTDVQLIDQQLRWIYSAPLVKLAKELYPLMTPLQFKVTDRTIPKAERLAFVTFARAAIDGVMRG